MTPPTMTSLKRRYNEATGDDMPLSIQKMPLEKIIRAVKLVEDGQTVFVPVDREPAVAACDSNELPLWDKHQEF